MQTDLCPCCSNQAYQDCCAPIHQNPANAIHPEQLMRARYSAHPKGLIDFIVATYHSECGAESFREDIATMIQHQWQSLEVFDSEVLQQGELGFVTFKAHFIADGEPQCLHERSRFVKETIDGQFQWRYIDGVFPGHIKAGRNDPCPCGSGRKFKKCCG
ncbi:hypothetical protein BGL48_09660 [Salinivibrio sp. SS3]|uniref:YchJ family metal-binding protein n=1 Tax=Salinivibrio sp. SS3 TaxID=1895021 RepID=UPI0008481CF7|nr:YchJ family metal-binding protein [Salinivibrio sp. BNH]ODP99015.1 hypothetical protein BGL48_09660 [Salinivibrio sp. BNH]